MVPMHEERWCGHRSVSAKSRVRPRLLDLCNTLSTRTPSGTGPKELTRSCPYLSLLAFTSGFLFRFFEVQVVFAGGRAPSPVRVVPPSLPVPNAPGCCVRIIGIFRAAVKHHTLPEDTTRAFISNRSSMLWQRSEGTVDQLLPSRVLLELAPQR